MTLDLDAIEARANADFCILATQDVPALVARVRELEIDAARLDWLAADLLSDVVMGAVDVPERAWVVAMRDGREEPTERDIAAAVREAIDAARGTT